MPKLPELPARSKASRFYGSGMSFLWFACTGLVLGVLLLLHKVLKLSPKTAPVPHPLARQLRRSLPAKPLLPNR